MQAVFRVEKRRIFDEQNEADPNKMAMLQAFRKALPAPIPRIVIKQTVMTTVYGVTLLGAREQIKRQLKALGIPEEEVGFIRFMRHLRAFNTQCIWQSKRLKVFMSLLRLPCKIQNQDEIIRLREIKEWFQNVASKIAGIKNTVEWRTPLGLPVVQVRL